MGTKKNPITPEAKRFIQRVKKTIKPEQIILFGSRAYGEPMEYSDYDFIIVADTFKKEHWLDRISSVIKHWDSDKPIDILPYTPDEFSKKKKESRMVREAARRGNRVL